jgi:hypothetical protein
MKNLRILSIVCTLVMVFTIPASVFATEADTLPNPGITPDSPFYFADKLGDQISMMFIFKPDGKVQKALRYAEERLAEVEAMAAQNKVQAMGRAANEYCDCLAIATRNMQKAMVKGVDTSEQVSAMMSRHISFICQKGNAVDEDCQQIKERIRDRAATCQEAAVQALASQDPEAALRLNLSLMVQECSRLKNQVGQEDNGQIEDALQQYERLRVMNREMLANAEQLRLSPESQQMAQQATANQDGILAQICNQLQIRNNASAESPLQTSTEQQQRLRPNSESDEQTMSAKNPEQRGEGDNGASYGESSEGAGPGLHNSCGSNAGAGSKTNGTGGGAGNNQNPSGGHCHE